MARGKATECPKNCLLTINALYIIIGLSVAATGLHEVLAEARVDTRNMEVAGMPPGANFIATGFLVFLVGGVGCVAAAVEEGVLVLVYFFTLGASTLLSLIFILLHAFKSKGSLIGAELDAYRTGVTAINPRHGVLVEMLFTIANMFCSAYGWILFRQVSPEGVAVSVPFLANGSHTLDGFYDSDESDDEDE